MPVTSIEQIGFVMDLLSHFLFHPSQNFLPTPGLLWGPAYLGERVKKVQSCFPFTLAVQWVWAIAPLLCEWTSDQYLLECCLEALAFVIHLITIRQTRCWEVFISLLFFLSLFLSSRLSLPPSVSSAKKMIALALFLRTKKGEAVLMCLSNDGGSIAATS